MFLTRSSVGLTLLPLPMSLLKSPSQWTTVVNGNVWITAGLFTMRYVDSSLHDDMTRSFYAHRVSLAHPRTGWLGFLESADDILLFH